MLGGGYALSQDLVQYPNMRLFFLTYFDILKYFAENWEVMHQWKPEDLTIGIHLQYLFIYIFLSSIVTLDIYLRVTRIVDNTIFKTDNKEILCDHDYLVNHKVLFFFFLFSKMKKAN